MDVTGIAAVLHRPMRDRQIVFGDPSPPLLPTPVLVTRDGQQVGAVRRAWVDGDLVRWEGHLPPPVWTWEDVPDDLLVPLVDPSLSGLVAEGWLVGVVDLCQGEMTTGSGGAVFSRWSIASIALLPRAARPWAELVLRPSR